MDRFLVPRLGFALVIGLATTLIWVIVLRSPATHAHLWETERPDYTRTPLALVGQKAGPIELTGDRAPLGSGATAFLHPQASLGSVGAADAGRAIYLSQGCATCHGLDARGGPVGPALAGINSEIVAHMVREGPGGMPSYPRERLGDEDMGKLAAYLQGLPFPKVSSQDVAAVQRLTFDPATSREELLMGKAAVRRSCGACHGQPTKDEIRRAFATDFDAASLVAQMVGKTTLTSGDAQAIVRYMQALRNALDPVEEP